MKQQIPSKKRRNSSRKLRTILRHMMLASILMVVIAVSSAIFWLFKSGKIQHGYHTVQQEVVRQLVQWGFQLEHIYLEGQVQSSNNAILDALGSGFGYPVFSLSLPKIKHNLESINWVKHAIVERQLPNTLHIKIEERHPMAMWQYKHRLQVLDNDGKVIPNVDLAPFSDLIIFVGEDAPSHASRFLAMVREDSDLMKRITSATRVSDRRWNITFDNGLLVKLPEKHPERAWKQLVKLIDEKKIFEEHIEMIDLRMADRLYMTKEKLKASKKK